MRAIIPDALEPEFLQAGSAFDQRKETMSVEERQEERRELKEELEEGDQQKKIERSVLVK